MVLRAGTLKIHLIEVVGFNNNNEQVRTQLAMSTNKGKEVTFSQSGSWSQQRIQTVSSLILMMSSAVGGFYRWRTDWQTA